MIEHLNQHHLINHNLSELFTKLQNYKITKKTIKE